MRSRRDESDDSRIELLLARIWPAVPAPSEDELQEIARSARVESAPIPARRRGGALIGFRPRLRWTVIAAAAALLVGSGLGFGLGNSITPSGSAGRNVVGFGFLPARGWTVVQAGVLDSSSAATAVAANVPLRPEDQVGDIPHATLVSMPEGGVLIHATSTTRGDAGEDARFVSRELPLDVATAKRVSPSKESDVAQYRLLAGVGGYNIDARIYFGGRPSPRMLAKAQRQLGRLVVTSERVTIVARPTVVAGNGLVDLFGSVETRKGGEAVAIQAKDCGKDFFRVVAGATTREGGSWSTAYYPAITTSVRAVWNDVASRQVTIRQRIPVTLSRTQSAGRYDVEVVGRKSFWRKRVSIQRFDRRLGTWSSFKTVVLAESVSTGSYVRSSGEFTARLPRRTLLRAVLPLSQSRPCYLAGTSNTLTS
jgi:hypothetical protein